MILAITQSAALLIMWIIFCVLAMAGLIAVLVWAIRTRQFANQDRARYLALNAGIPKEDKPTTEDTENKKPKE